MRVLALTTQKGGSGKSTLAASLAVAAMQDGETVAPSTRISRRRSQDGGSGARPSAWTYSGLSLPPSPARSARSGMPVRSPS